MSLTQIEIFRLIEFHFVFESSVLRFADFQRRATLDARPNSGRVTMAPQFRLMKCMLLFFLCGSLGLSLARAQAQSSPRPSASSDCRVEAVDYKGWHAQQLSNRWVQLVMLPQNGGRLIQVTFAGHPYLFVNPQYEGKYLPPSTTQWFNYGGDKLWLLPEGNEDEQHWVGNSDVLDDGPFTFRKLSEGPGCGVELTGPADPLTGIQFQRTIRLENDSPRIRFHATMKNISGHSLEWSMQSVSQYDTADRSSASSGPPSRFNHDFRTFVPANPASIYLNRYHVRFGPAENHAVSIREDGLFTVHYVHMAAELWLDSTAGWLAVVDGATHYGMVERFRFDESRPYPGKASVIFWTNGPEMRLNADGEPSMPSSDDASPYYLEAELNSPLCRLRPGESCDFDTEWFPTRTGTEFHGVTEAGILIRPLQATRLENGHVKLAGTFGVFFSGRLVAHFYSEHGASIANMPVAEVNPFEVASLDTEISPPGKAGRVSLHLEDSNGIDRGSLQEIQVSTGENR